MTLAQAQPSKTAWLKQRRDAEHQIDGVLDRVVEAATPSVITACEARIETREPEKIVLAERAAKALPPKGRLEV